MGGPSGTLQEVVSTRGLFWMFLTEGAGCIGGEVCRQLFVERLPLRSWDRGLERAAPARRVLTPPFADQLSLIASQTDAFAVTSRDTSPQRNYNLINTQLLQMNQTQHVK